MFGLSPKVIFFLGAAAFIFALGWNYKATLAENTTLKESLKSANAAVGECKADQEKAYEISNDYQKKLAATDRRLADAKRMLSQSSCVIPCGPDESASGCDAKTPAGLPGKNGIRVEWLLEEAARADRYTQQLNACQDWAERNGQKK